MMKQYANGKKKMNPRIRNLYPSVTRDGRFSKECQQLLVLYIIQNVS